MIAFIETTCEEEYRNLFDINFIEGDKDYTVIAEHITEVFEGNSHSLVAIATFQANQPNMYLDANEVAIKDKKYHDLIMTLNDYKCDVRIQQLTREGVVIEEGYYKDCTFNILDTYHTYTTDKESYDVKYAIVINAGDVIKKNI